jgi:Flp pilus assembly pilin Flp
MKSNKLSPQKKYLSGQGMSEYLIIIGLVAVAGIGVMSFFGQSIQHQVAGMSTEISGGDAGAEIAASAATAGQATASAAINTTLGNYNTKQP